jgi:hypothetical protein
MEKELFNHFHFVRGQTIAALDATTEELADKIPEGFLNNIRWNLGHIYLSLDNLLYSYLGENHTITDEFMEMFQYHTSPKDWDQSKVPSLKQLKDLLIEQENRIKETFTNRVHEQGERVFDLGNVQLKSLAEVFSFALWHEGRHQGVIIGLKRALGVEDLWQSPKDNLKK